MTYSSLRKLIENKNRQYENLTISKEEYQLWAENTKKQMDLFLMFNRITESQYQELMGMFLTFEEES